MKCRILFMCDTFCMRQGEAVFSPSFYIKINQLDHGTIERGEQLTNK